ncbi:MAG: C40 family peptidase [Verrucomicrobia bacterium]|nr:C40 family peptidase [Verrucomicrobiota bacterium]
MNLSARQRKVLGICWRLAGLLCVLLVLYPIANTLSRIAVIGFGGLFWLGALLLFWQKRLVRFTALALAAVPGVFLILPGRNPDQTRLRAAYVSELKSFEGTRYVWGGENFLGVDCSGLVRKGFINACAKQGLTTLNPRLVRAVISLWWFDTSAEAMGNEYRGVAKVLDHARSLNQFDHSKLQPGDFAVMGIHTMAYLGDETWVEADPHDQKVIQLHTGGNSPWLGSSVKLMRWRILE